MDNLQCSTFNDRLVGLRVRISSCRVSILVDFVAARVFMHLVYTPMVQLQYNEIEVEMSMTCLIISVAYGISRISKN